MTKKRKTIGLTLAVVGIMVFSGQACPPDANDMMPAPAPIPGPQGDQGPPGPPGADGQDGASPFTLLGNDAVYTQGNVGIGTESPQALLQVGSAYTPTVAGSTARVNGTLGVNGTIVSDQGNILSRADGSSIPAGTAVVQVDATGTGGKTWRLLSHADSNPFGAVGGSFTIYQSQLREHVLAISETGDVGIGAGNPTSKLTVRDNTNAQVLDVQNSGSGTAARFGYNGATGGDIAIFQTLGSNMARIDDTGKGFFNGGTQTGGADLAEAFAVEGGARAYEPGDVMVISTDSDRTMRLSSKPYSTLVAGVYATQPGVLLTERGIDESLDDLVPVGMVGVLPTKVTLEGGPIRRGDLLVTSSTPGHAMKGTDRGRIAGAILGKALENFDGPKTGMIKVLVNAR